jgi:GAF domain-containing protein
LLIRAAYGLSEGYLHKGPVLLERSEVDRETLNGRPVYVCDMADDQRIQYREEARLEGLCSLLCVPLKAHETVIGVLRVYAADRHEFSEPEIHLAQALADLGALAIQNAREHEQLETDYQYLVNYVQGVTA